MIFTKLIEQKNLYYWSDRGREGAGLNVELAIENSIKTPNLKRKQSGERVRKIINIRTNKYKVI